MATEGHHYSQGEPCVDVKLRRKFLANASMMCEQRTIPDAMIGGCMGDFAEDYGVKPSGMISA